MKYLPLIAAIAVLSLSCNPILYPLPDKDYERISNIHSDRPYDTVWARTCRFLAGNGFTFKENDKDKGLLVTNKYDFSKTFSFVKNGKPMDSTAWVALSYNTNKGGFGSNPFKVVAKWTISIKPSAAGATIRIDMGWVDAHVTKPAKKSFHPEQEYTFIGQSTGVFEKMLADAVK